MIFDSGGWVSQECGGTGGSKAGSMGLIGSRASWELPRYNLTQHPSVEGRDSLKKEAGHPRLVGCRFLSRGTDVQGLSWVAAGRADLHTQPPNLKSFVEASARYSHIHHPEDLTIARLCLWGSL